MGILGFIGNLLGRSRVRAPREDRFRNVLKITEISEIVTCDKAGVLFNPEEGASMASLTMELQDLMMVNESTVGTEVDLVTDEFETGWIVLENRKLDCLVASLQILNQTLFERGNGDRLLAAVLRVNFEGEPAYCLYNYKRGYFHPLVLGNSERRDNDSELRLGQLMERTGIAVENSLEHWYGLSGIPF
jgi:hypothetical protein